MGSTPGQFGGSQFGNTLFGGPTPASSIIDKTLVAIVRQMLDQTAGDLFWSSQQIYDCSNEALIDFWTNVKPQISNTPFVVTSGADIVAYSTTSIMIPQFFELSTNTANASIDQCYWVTDRTKLEQWNRFWRLNEPAQPRWFVLWDTFNIRVFPTPDQTYTFTLWGVPYPPEISSTNEDLVINGVQLDREFKLAMAYRIAGNLLLYSRPDVSQEYFKAADEGLGWYKRRLRNRQPNNIRRLKPGVGGRGIDVNIGANKGILSIGRRLS